MYTLNFVINYKGIFTNNTYNKFNYYTRKKSYACADLYDEKIATFDGICCEFKSRPIDKDDLSWALQFRPSQYPIR